MIQTRLHKRLELISEEHYKFWEVTLYDNASYEVRWGRIGKNESRKLFTTENDVDMDFTDGGHADAKGVAIAKQNWAYVTVMEKIQSKIKKGYREAS